MRKFALVLLSIFFYALPAQAQYAPQVGVAGSTAIAATNPLIQKWAKECVVQRGFMDIAQPSLGYASSGSDNMGIGMVDNFVVSLGDSGRATLKFDHFIVDGPGADFAVFENGFADPNNPADAFLELAFVEVSSDGVNYVRFAACSYTQTDTQIAVAGMYMNATKVNNLAGKYISNYGTPFDLQELAGTAGLNTNGITHVRLVDVVGSIDNNVSLDTAGNKINDPYPTAIPTGGFDLDAVGVLHAGASTGVYVMHNTSVAVYPNPTSDYLQVRADGKLLISLSDLAGRHLWSGNVQHELIIPLSGYSKGFYILTFTDSNGNKWCERILKL
jgi:hypothetical protein